MPKTLLFHFTNPVEGREDEYNDWYSNRHLDDLLATEGFEAAQRFEFVPSGASPEAPFRYLAIYEATGGDRKVAEAALRAAREEREDALQAGREPRVPLSDAIAPGASTWWFTEITERRTS